MMKDHKAILAQLNRIFGEGNVQKHEHEGRPGYRINYTGLSKEFGPFAAGAQQVLIIGVRDMGGGFAFVADREVEASYEDLEKGSWHSLIPKIYEAETGSEWIPPEVLAKLLPALEALGKKVEGLQRFIDASLAAEEISEELAAMGQPEMAIAALDKATGVTWLHVPELVMITTRDRIDNAAEAARVLKQVTGGVEFRIRRGKVFVHPANLENPHIQAIKTADLKSSFHIASREREKE